MQLHSLFITPVFSLQLKGHEHLIDMLKIVLITWMYKIITILK